MLKLGHPTVVAPSLEEGFTHVRFCLDMDVPFGTRHAYMGTHNHRLRLGETVYLEIVAVDPFESAPRGPRWFGLDHSDTVRRNWEMGRRLRSWVANTSSMDRLLESFGGVFGVKRNLPEDGPEFSFAVPVDGSLPEDGALPSVIDHCGDTDFIATIPDFGARLRHLDLACPEPERIADISRSLQIDRPPNVGSGESVRYRAVIDTPRGPMELW
ncbi:riboflavin deaminase [Tabrizicola sp. TH137]|uniref:VOC family protein n=1 Tax=Tabrizicola sp. TH137 TaxID=2067452 RepID=UPI000C7DFB00|nr:VOC family protein [Tabrizicola sp. TH137]PLL10190.1 riboflavin deaminase [Tabrizicola sp. TH137]